MFKVGDRVVCIDDYNGFDHKFDPIEYLIENNIYTIKKIIDNTDGYNVRLKEISNFSFSPHRFILLSKYRKRKINKIISNVK